MNAMVLLAQIKTLSHLLFAPCKALGDRALVGAGVLRFEALLVHDAPDAPKRKRENARSHAKEPADKEAFLPRRVDLCGFRVVAIRVFNGGV